MINLKKIKDVLSSLLAENQLFLIDLSVSKLNKIVVIVDSIKGVSIEECTAISKEIEKNFNRDEEDYDLEVSSPGINTPFKFFFQYKKNEGRNIELVNLEGKVFKGKLKQAERDYIKLEIDENDIVQNKIKNKSILKEYIFELNKIKSARVVFTL